MKLISYIDLNTRIIKRKLIFYVMKYFLVLFICFEVLHNQLVAISSGYEDGPTHEDVPQPFFSNAESLETLKGTHHWDTGERMAGDVTELLGSNVHYRQPVMYDDYGRRFLFVSNDGNKKNIIPGNDNLAPMKAPPELVIALAKLSAKRQANTVVDPLEELAKRSIVRTGDYWDGVWKENVEIPTNNVLRSTDKTKNKSVPGIGIVKAKVAPGSKLYQLISVLQQFSPRLLYVVNKEEGK